MHYTEIDKVLESLERFLNCNPDGSSGIHYTRHNLRLLYVEVLKNPNFEAKKEQISLLSESFLFLDEILEKLQPVTPDEVERLRCLVRGQNS